jgi:hypothetical protein
MAVKEFTKFGKAFNELTRNYVTWMFMR